MKTETSETAAAELDARAIEAVRSGDTERYRELVERHERHVYAVAWCRLGDQDMAEEATQETFIKAFRQLPLLGHTGKFAAWITAIARNAAINIGLRRRAEMERRERWAVEQPKESAPDHADEPTVPSDILKQTLAELPENHRECLVLFYLQNQTVASAAATLGISENAFKTRLHRARSVLREKLAETLEGSLDSLRPGRALAPLIMAIIFANKAEAAATAGGGGLVLMKLGGGVAKVLPFGLLTTFIPLLSIIPAYLLRRRQVEMQQRNFKNQEDFRARLHRRMTSNHLTLALLFMLPVGLGVLMTSRALAPGVVIKIFGILFALQVPLVIRMTRLIPNAYQKAQAVGMTILVVGMLAVGFLDLNWMVLVILQSFFFLTAGLTVGQRPTRMDYNLFLRARHELLATPDESAPETNKNPIPRSELFQFARELGKRWMVKDYKWTESGLQLYVTGVESSILMPAIPGFWGDASTLTLLRTGGVRASLGDKDLKAICRNTQDSKVEPAGLERSVVSAVKRAFVAFRDGRLEAIGPILGEVPDANLFHQPEAKSRATRSSQRTMIACGLVFLLGNGFVWWSTTRPNLGHPPKPVAVPNATAVESLRNKTSGLWKSEGDRLSADPLFGMTMVHPPQSMIPNDYLETLLSANLPAKGHPDRPRQLVVKLMGDIDMQKALMGGLVQRERLQAEGVTEAMIRATVGEQSDKQGHNPLLQLLDFNTSTSGDQPATAVSPSYLLPRLELLAMFQCLDLVNSTEIITRLKRCQVLPGVYSNGPAVSNEKSAHGLFLCQANQPIKDTYHALAILKLLGGLDAMDRDACVKGILRFHRGQGLFLCDIKKAGLYMTGDAQETLCAYESLRILNALGRVPDLKQWKFRPTRFAKTNDDLIWPEVEAWLLQSRLETLAAGDVPPDEWPSLLKEAPIKATLAP